MLRKAGLLVRSFLMLTLDGLMEQVGKFNKRKYRFGRLDAYKNDLFVFIVFNIISRAVSRVNT